MRRYSGLRLVETPVKKPRLSAKAKVPILYAMQIARKLNFAHA